MKYFTYYQRLRRYCKDLNHSQKADLRGFVLLLLALAYLLYFCFYCSVTSAQEVTVYQVEKSQLEQLEKNLTRLEIINGELQKKDEELLQAQMKQKNELNKAYNTIATLQKQEKELMQQVQSLEKSLQRAKQLLKQSKKENNRAIGLGYNTRNNSLGLNGDYHHMWWYVDKDNTVLGYKVRY